VKIHSFAAFLSGLLVIGLLGGCTAASPETASSQPEVVADPDATVVKNQLAQWGQWGGYGTVYITPEVITPKSPSDFLELTFTGLSDKETFDRRVDDFVKNPSYVFTASFRCATETVDVVVNSEFTQEKALQEAERFAYLLGQMPLGLRGLVREIWVHDGNELAGGGNESILVHSGYADQEKDFIEEVFAHEAAHTSLDYDQGGIVDRKLWAAAIASDGVFVSEYSAEFPDREDIAESYGAYLIWALHRDQGIFSEVAQLIQAVIPARLKYFESLGPDFGPLSAQCG
jgi:hypothetical protein